jgi:hypothetical protein
MHIDDDEDDRELVKEVVQQISPGTKVLEFPDGQSD